ncbi:hypothetical protein a10_00395 [Streptomyces acidiscabies]|nr:hypothetical protein a10_00395 [Streptomyces acidiscabies]GAV40025.1 hypothetical protein Saa2_02913 [Streptomyces acidiscabies]
MCAQRQAGEVEDQGCSESRVAALPGRLERHPCAEETIEGDVVPRGLPVTEGGYVVDVDAALGGRAQRVGEDPLLARVLRGGGTGIGQRGTVPTAEEVDAGPGTNVQRTPVEHRTEDRAQEGLPGLPVPPGVRQPARLREPRERGVVQPRGGREVDVGTAGPQSSRRIQRTRRQSSPVDRRLGGRDVHDDRTGKPPAPHEVLNIRGKSSDVLLVTLQQPERTLASNNGVTETRRPPHLTRTTGVNTSPDTDTYGIRPATALAPGTHITRSTVGDNTNTPSSTPPPPHPDLPVSSGQFPLHRSREPHRQYPLRRQFLRPLHQRCVRDVMAPEDQRSQRR